MHLEKGERLPNRVQDLENNWSPNSQTIKNLEERRPLVGDEVGDRGLPDGSEQDDPMQDIRERDQERLESEEMIGGADNLTADKGVDMGVHEPRDYREISQETEEGCENLEVFDEILGEGEFGIVYKGGLCGKDGNKTDVAVKKLKGTYTKSKCQFINS